VESVLGQQILCNTASRSLYNVRTIRLKNSEGIQEQLDLGETRSPSDGIISLQTTFRSNLPSYRNAVAPIADDR